MSLLARASARYLRRHPAQLALAVAGIALGVAVVVGVALANDSARRAFEVSVDLVRGRSTHQLLGLDGTLPESLYPRLRRELGVRRAAPVIEARILLPDVPGRPFTLLGVDPLAESPFRAALAPGRGAAGVDLARLMTEPATVVLWGHSPFRKDMGNVPIIAAGRPATVQVAGIVDVSAAVAAGSMLLADIATAQELLGMQGRITRIDLVLDDEEAARLEQADLGGAILVDASAEDAALEEMTRAFRVNLTALGLLALVVGVFLIYATLSFLVVQRRGLIGIERALGVTARQVSGVVLAEALLLGAVGTLAGLALGAWLGQGLVALVLRTVEDLYFAREVAAVSADPWIFVQGAALGLGATLVAALAPALEAARAPPRAAMSRAVLERRTRARLPRLALLGSVSLALAAVLLLLPTRSLVVAFAGLFGVIAAAALFTPALALAFLRAAERPAALLGHLPGRLAARGAAASLSRTGVAVTALSVAVATVIGVGVMIGSFRTSVADWLGETLQADFYLRLAPGVPARASTELSPEAVAGIKALPGVAGVSLTRWLRLPTPEGGLQLRAVEPGPRGWGLTVLEGEQSRLKSLPQGAVLVSEPFARRRDLHPGDMLELPTPAGPARFPVAGVVRDYSTDRGAVTMHRDTYLEHWHDESLTGVGVYLSPGADREKLRQALERRAAATPDLELTSSAELRTASMRIFERTFTITAVLRWLAGLVAFFGILSALSALALERARELAVLRALGLTPAQLRRLVLTETGLLGLASGLVALPLGLALAALLVFVINERAFGWSMAFHAEPAVLAQGLLLALAAALLAGVLPAWRLSRAPLASALREE